MGTLYTLITKQSIVGIRILDIVLSLLFDSISFSIAWKIGSFGPNSKVRHVLHWTTRIVMFIVLVAITKGIATLI